MYHIPQYQTYNLSVIINTYNIENEKEMGKEKWRRINVFLSFSMVKDMILIFFFLYLSLLMM